MNKVKKILLSGIVLVGLCACAVQAHAASNIIVEGESYFKASMPTEENVHNALSGGKALVVKTAGTATKAATVLFKVQSPVEATYDMYITCPTIGATWISPCEIRINDGTYTKLTDMKYQQVGTLNGTGVSENLYNKYKLSTISLRKGVNNIYVRVTDGRSSDGRMFFYLDCMEFELLPFNVHDLKAGDFLSISEEKELVKPTIVFPYEDSNAHSLTYSLKDYFGNTLKEESVTLKNTKEYEIPIDDKLPKGHYTVRASVDGLEEKEFYFSVVIDSEKREGLNNRSFMVDSAVSRLTGMNFLPDYAKSLKLAGVSSVRERSSYPDYYTDDDIYDFSIVKQIRDVYNENGIDVMTVTGSIPDEMKRDADDEFPTNLLEVYNMFKAVKQEVGTGFDVEALNEPDTKEPADRLAAYIKTKTIAEIDSGMPSKFIGPGFYSLGSFTSERIRVPEITAQNDVLDYLNAWSYHAHISGASSNIVEFKDRKQATINYYHEIADRYGYPNEIYLYNTEAGTTIPAAADQNFELQKFQTRYAVTSMIDSVMSGVDKHYWFVYPYYNERGSLWGTFTEDHMPHSAYNSIAALTYVMADTQHIGEIEIADVYCYVFNKNEKQLAVIYSENEKNIEISTDSTKGTLVDIMGNEKEISAENGVFSITASPDVQYLIIDSKFNNVTGEGLLEKNVKPIELTKAQRVVLSQEYSDNCSINVGGSGLVGYQINNDNDIEVTVRVTNLNDTSMSGKIIGTSFAGLEFVDNEQNVTVGPFAEAEVKFILKQSSSMIKDAHLPVKFEGIFGKEKTSKSVTYLVRYGDYDIELKETFVDFDNTTNWESNISTGSKSTITKESDGVVLFEHTFGETSEGWVYPYLDVKNENMENATGIYCEIYFVDYVPYADIRAYAHEKNGSRYLSGRFWTTDFKPNEWNKVYLPYNEFEFSSNGTTDYTFNLEPEEIIRIQLGCNNRSEGREIKYKVRNLGYYETPISYVKSNVSSLTAQVSGNVCVLSADVDNNDVGVDFDNTIIVIDGEEMKPNYVDNKISVTKTLASGTHTATLRAFDLSGRSVGYETISFDVK